MSRPRRWPLHPKPSPGEALSSWLTRLARLYDLSLPELLRHNLGAPVDIRTPGEVDRLNLDVDPPAWVLSGLQERTGLDQQELRRMTIAGWVPWLLDDIQPDEGIEAFTTYVRSDSVLLPPRRSPIGQARTWRPWLPAPGTELLNRACRRCVADLHRGLTLMAKIPLMLTCPEHGCRLDDVPGHPADYLHRPDLHWPDLCWPDTLEPARPPGAAVLAMDRLTQEGLSTGIVNLPRRPVHVGVWLRLLRTLLDEVATGSTRLPPSKDDDLRRIWSEAGYPFRDGLGVWKVYETLGWARQQAMLQAAAMALQLIMDGQIQTKGTLGHLLTKGPAVPIFDGDPPQVDHRKILLAKISAALDTVQHDHAIAPQLITLVAAGDRGRPAYDRVQHLLTQAGVPGECIPSFGEYLAATYDPTASLRAR